MFDKVLNTPFACSVTFLIIKKHHRCRYLKEDDLMDHTEHYFFSRKPPVLFPNNWQENKMIQIQDQMLQVIQSTRPTNTCSKLIIETQE